MSEALLMTDVFKNASAVSQLDSADRLLAVDANGSPKKIIRNQVAGPYSSVQVTGAQWVRVAKFNGSAGLLASIQTDWNTNVGERILVDLLLHHHSGSYNKCTVLSRMCNSSTSGVIKKLRIVIKGNAECYIDLYYAASNMNPLYFRSYGGDKVTIIATPELNAVIPEGYTAKEFDLTQAAWGGVNRYFTTVYKSKKGGVPHERGCNHDKRYDEDHHVGLNGGQRLLLECGHHNNSRCLQSRYGNHEQAFPGLRNFIPFSCQRHSLHASTFHWLPCIGTIALHLRANMLDWQLECMEQNFFLESHLAGKEVVAA